MQSPELAATGTALVAAALTFRFRNGQDQEWLGHHAQRTGRAFDHQRCIHPALGSAGGGWSGCWIA